jgi:hypothetical protein
MHDDEIKIIQIFKEGSKRNLSTTEIVEQLYKNDFNKIKKDSETVFDSKDKEEEFKRQKAKLHRKTLYHINKLVEDNLLEVTGIKDKNQKIFSLSVEHDEDLIIENTNRKRIVISRPNLPAMPIEGYEQKNLLRKYEEATWISRINSTMIQAKTLKDLSGLKEIIIGSFSFVNDTVGVNDFEYLIELSTENEIRIFFEKLEEEAGDYGKNISFTIDYSNIRNELKVMTAIKSFSDLMPRNLNIIFDMTAKELQRFEHLTETIVELFSRAKIQLYIKNQECHDAPYILGKAGPYTYSEDEWNYYREEFGNKITNIICGQSTVSVDVKEFFRTTKSSYEFRQFVINIAKSLLYANSMQRSRSSEYFKYFIDINKPLTSNLFSYSRSYIRFWNYGWKETKIDPGMITELIKSIKQTIDEFCTSEEIIYKSCGMPTRFKLSFSCAFKEANKEEFSSEKFRRLQIRKIEDLYSDDIKSLIFSKENVFKIFDGGDRLRFHRGGKFEPKDVVRELNIILNTYRIPFFCYDFGEIRGNDMSLSTFIEDEEKYDED